MGTYPETRMMRSQSVQRCYVCGGSGVLVYRDLTDSVFSAAGLWSFRKCESDACGLLWLDPMPLEDDLHLAYQDYYTHRDAGESKVHRIGSLLYAIGTGALLSLVGVPQERRRSHHMFISDKDTGDMLDVGCGSGDLLIRMQKKGWKAMGIDVDAAAIDKARRKHGVDAHVGVPADLAAQGRLFDIVTADHVIEHVVDPIEFLRDCRRLLRPGGRVILKTPNAQSFGLRRYGGSWRGLEPPRHLHIFTMSALKSCALKSGFTRFEFFTSSANADRILAVSRIIARRGRFEERRLPRTEKLKSWLVRPFLALRAKIVWLMDDSSGEEICAILEVPRVAQPPS
jgi:2-polyprenyl-3-methyl-5-hydroxy-6-metoxy-1,4-benzoquinol methylase